MSAFFCTRLCHDYAWDPYNPSLGSLEDVYPQHRYDRYHAHLHPTTILLIYQFRVCSHLLFFSSVISFLFFLLCAFRYCLLVLLLLFIVFFSSPISIPFYLVLVFFLFFYLLFSKSSKIFWSSPICYLLIYFSCSSYKLLLSFPILSLSHRSDWISCPLCYIPRYVL